MTAGADLSTESFPEYTPAERSADACVHVAGIVLSVAAAGILVAISIAYLPPLSTVSLAIYCVGTVAVFCISAGYNMVTQPRLKSLLRRWDHAAIFVKIAATYTPFAMIKIGGFTGALLLAAVWIIAAVGVVAKLGWPERFPRAAIALYLGQGWAGIAAFDVLVMALSTGTLAMLLIGGVLYTVGVVFHLWQSLPYHNAIWHAFVLTASACMFTSIVLAVLM